LLDVQLTGLPLPEADLAPEHEQGAQPAGSRSP
jgi:hypothetical protein